MKPADGSFVSRGRGHYRVFEFSQDFYHEDYDTYQGVEGEFRVKFDTIVNEISEAWGEPNYLSRDLHEKIAGIKATVSPMSNLSTLTRNCPSCFISAFAR